MSVYGANARLSGGKVTSKSSLIRAVKTENLEQTQEIVRDDSDSVLEVDPRTKETPLHVASYQGLADFVDAILESPSIDFATLDARNNDVLQAAMLSGQQDVLQKVFDAIEKRAPHIINNPPKFGMDDFS